MYYFYSIDLIIVGIIWIVVHMFLLYLEYVRGLFER